MLAHALRARADAQVIAGLLKEGANPNSPGPRNEGGFRPLHIAVHEAQASALHSVEVLLEGGANPNGLAAGGQSPLLTAVGSPSPMWTEQADLISRLLRAGANPNHANELGHTPLMYAVAVTLTGAPLLLRAGADAAAKDRDGWSVLDWVQNDDAERALSDLAGVARSAEEASEFCERETPMAMGEEEQAPGVRPADAARTADYLAQGYPLLDYGTDDEFSWLTDGRWAWRRGFVGRVRRGESRVPPDLPASVAARGYRMPFLDPAKLFFKTRMVIGKWGATYAMPRSMYDYVHEYFCRAE